MSNSLPWEVIERPVMVENQIVSGFKSLVRSDDNQVLTICKQSYTPTLNNRLTDFAEKLCDTMGFENHGFSEFHGGRKVLVHLKNNEEQFKVAGCDFKDYLLIGNSHDGTHPFWIGTDTTMIRCQNRFARKLRNMSVRHTTNHDFKIEEILGYFKSYQKEKDLMKINLEKMTKIKVSEELLISLSERLFQIEMVEERLKEVSQTKVNQIHNFMESVETEMSDLGENLFAVWNGVTHYTSHKTRQTDNLFDNNFNLNQTAYNFCLEKLN